MGDLLTRNDLRYETVDSVIKHIYHIIRQQRLTFVEEQIVLSWLQCELSYEIGKISTKSFLEDIVEARNEMPVRSAIYK